MKKIERALLSLTDKAGALEFARGLQALGAEVLSTGNTARLLREGGVKVIEVAEYTGFPEMLDGRVKTLHPRVFAGILARREVHAHEAQMREHGLGRIDLVAVNLYPFERTVAQPGVALEEAIENVDIGGPSLIRAAAKNHEDVAVVVDPADYPSILAELRAGGGSLALPTLRRLARKAFERTAAYDGAIAGWLATRPEFGGDPGGIDPSFLRLGPGSTLRYGENPHQRAVFHPLVAAREPSVATATKLSGKELSYNNILDCDAALALVREFAEPCCVVVKHTNPCGAALAADVNTAYERALAGDPVSAFGGILAFNVPVGPELAEQIARPDRFFECIIAPSFDPGAVELLTTRPKWGKNVRLLAAGSGDADPSDADVRKVRGGLLIQDRDGAGADDPFQAVTSAVDPALEATLRFAWIVVKHVKSNAIVLARDRALVGVGAGQMSRVDAVFMAVHKAGDRARGAVLASDAFFPFRDGVDQAARAGVVAIVQPGGSVRDAEVIAPAKEHGIAMVFTGARHFRH